MVFCRNKTEINVFTPYFCLSCAILISVIKKKKRFSNLRVMQDLNEVAIA